NEIKPLKLNAELLEWVRSRPDEPGQISLESTKDPPGKNLRLGRGNRPRKASATASSESEQLEADPAFDQEELAVASGSLREGRVLISAQDPPLVIQTRRGRGVLTVLTFSPEREPFRSWKNRAWFWAKVTDVPASALSSIEFNRYAG